MVHGGGQQGNVIDLTMWISPRSRLPFGNRRFPFWLCIWFTQVKVGYPTYYQVNDRHSGIYLLDRTDKNNLYIDHENTKQLAAKSIAINTGIDLVTGGILEAAPLIKLGKKLPQK